MRASTLVLLVLGGCGASPGAPLERPPPLHAPEGPCEGLQVPLRVQGAVLTPDGAPVARAPIGAWDGGWEVVGWTAADGSFSVDLPGPAWVGVASWPADPPATCMALPEHLRLPPPPPGGKATMILTDQRLRSAPACRWDLELPGLDGPATVVGWREGARMQVEGTADRGYLPVTLPCDLQAVVVRGATVGSAPERGCEVGVGATCVPSGGGRVRLAPTPLSPLRVEAPGRPGAVVTDGARDARVDPGLTWGVAAHDRLRVDAPGHAPALLSPGGEARHGALQAGVFRASPAPVTRADQPSGSPARR